MFSEPTFWIAVVAVLGISAAAWSAKWLSSAGAIAAMFVGLTFVCCGGMPATVPLAAFFVSSSILTFVCKERGRKQATANAGSEARSAYQVLANGGIAACLVLVHRIFAYHITRDNNRVIEILVLAALATANADTWSTEIGRRWGGTPRLLSTWRKVAPGTSGAVTILGVIAAAAGAVFVPLCTYRLWDLSFAEFVGAVWAAFLASLFDSILGAGVQAQYRNPDTGEISDTAITSGRRGVLIRGLPWVDNNLVNLAAGACGAFFCWVLLHYGLRNLL